MQDLKPRNIKPPFNRVPYVLLEIAAAAFNDGAAKYAPENWRNQGDHTDWRETYTAAMLRHAHAFADPDKPDYAEDSGVSHLGCAVACAAILAYHAGHGYTESTAAKESQEAPGGAKEPEDFDDAVKGGGVPSKDPAAPTMVDGVGIMDILIALGLDKQGRAV